MPQTRRPLLWLLLYSLVAFMLLYMGEKGGFIPTNMFAQGSPANLEIFADRPQRATTPLWNGVSQGYEHTGNMFSAIEQPTRQLGLDYIRIDHIFTGYELVNRAPDGQLQMNWTQLDETIETIRDTGATPVIVLSYMPPVLRNDQNIVSQPDNWNEWRWIVAQTVARYSGTQGKNIPNIYYEVWNEPDLFGDWHYSGAQQNYLTLYTQTARAIESVPNLNSYKLGGPGVTGYYHNWIKTLILHTQQNNLRLDFISWHRYTADVDTYRQEASDARQLLASLDAASLELIISEWGIDSYNNPANDGLAAAAHGVAVIDQLHGLVDHAWAFELKDGPDPEGRMFWGRWGMITHESSGVTIKPRYRAWQMMDALQSQELYVSGEGTWVKTIATGNTEHLTMIISNYDPRGRNTENVPITVYNLRDGLWRWSYQDLTGSSAEIDITLTDSKWSTELPITPNNIILVDMQRLR